MAVKIFFIIGAEMQEEVLALDVAYSSTHGDAVARRIVGGQ